MASADVGVVFSDDLKRHLLVRFLIDMMATDLLSETASRLERLGVSDLQSLRLAPEQVCCYSGDMGERVKELKSFLSTELYSHPHLVSRAEQAGEILRLLFEKLTADPTMMPARFQKMLENEKMVIVVADYIAGMTDRYAEKLSTKFSELRRG